MSNTAPQPKVNPLNLREHSKGMYIIPKIGLMRVPGLLISSPDLLSAPGIEKPIDQIVNVAHLPGIVGYSIAMPDIHWGYGFPIGGVAATYGHDAVISPGGVGYDINCGVRVALLDVPFSSITHTQRERISKKLHTLIPKGTHSGLKKGSLLQRPLSHQDWKELEKKGSQWAIEMGWGLQEDIDSTESLGIISGASIDAISATALERGKGQLGSIGSGNHFVEIGEVEKILDPDIASRWGIHLGSTYILIHSGSRGFGHQICHDTVTSLIKKGFGKDLPDPQLVSAPISSPEGKLYLSQMAMAANFAFTNRQLLLNAARQVFSEELSISPSSIRLLYDVAHNIAKFEKHRVDNKICDVLVHRKGATRAFGPGHPDLPPRFKETGQPVLVPGDMGRGSWILRGKGNEETFCSCCHGAGRMMSRNEATRFWKDKNPFLELKEKGIAVLAESSGTVVEEMPNAYKDVDEVVTSCQTAVLADLVARLKPAIVLKG